MKKVVAAMLASGMLFSTPVLAAGGSVAITKLSVKNGVISATVTNQAQTESRITLELIKDEAPLTEEEEIYALYQKVLEAGSSMEFTLEIPDERDGVPGTGSYYIEVENAAEQRDKISFQYADRNTLRTFIQTLKTEGSKAGQAEDAHQYLLPVFAQPVCSGIFFRFGLDYSAFSQRTEDIKKETMKQLYLNGLQTVEDTTFGSLFKGSYGLALYNQGERLDGLKTLSVEYNQEPIDEGLIADVVTMIQGSYQVPTILITDFTVAYGIETVNRADVNAMSAVLDAFKNETGLCVNEINQINTLNTAKKYTAYETVVLACHNSKLKTQEQLRVLLVQAYQEAIKDPQGSVPSGGGGGVALGGGNNKVPVVSDPNFGENGSGTAEDKVQTTTLFSDMPGSHWASGAVTWLKNKGVVNGTEKGTFEPDRQVTREEFTKMLVLACGLSADAVELTFGDVADDWYAPFIRTAVANGIINGIDSTRFGVGQNITRQDMAVMVKRALDVKGVSLDAVKEYMAFQDEKQIAEYALENVIALFKAGIINGKGENTFDSVGNATRAEAAKILYEALKGGK
ncbi:MAG: S-layer homology domain-containing protein [Clostridia bacterium]|nr:S-layer homology domain-containing protein [Clostridia bacterium]